MSIENAENFPHTPELFPDPQDTAAWFAGALEAGASTGIGVVEYTDKNGYYRIKADPYIEIHTSHLPLHARLFSIYGGMNKPRYWRKGGRKAAEIVADTLPFVVAREEHALAMSNWLNAETIAERVEVANDLENRGWQQRGNQRAYYELLTNPVFVAGILDNRGSMYAKSTRNFHTLGIEVTSKNTELLYALESKFAGEVRITEPAGTVVKHGEISFVTQVDSYVWGISGSDAIALVDFCQDYLQIPPPEDWDYQRTIERATEELELALSIATYVRQEMALIESGEIPRLSTNSVLSEIFGIGKRRISTYLKQQLSTEQYQLRLDTIRAFAKREINADDASQIATYIAQEVYGFLKGKIKRISYKQELADQFGVSIDTIQRHIFPLLDPEVQAARSKILKSQITVERNIQYWQERKNQ